MEAKAKSKINSWKRHHKTQLFLPGNVVSWWSCQPKFYLFCN